MTFAAVTCWFEAKLGAAVRIIFLLLVVAPAIFGARDAAAQPSASGDSDYATDPANTYVYDSSKEPLESVNMIL